MRIAGIIQLVYEAPRDLPVCVHSLLQPYGIRCQGAVQIHTVGVRKYHLRQCSPWGGELSCALPESYTSSTRLDGTSSLCTQPVAAVQHPLSERCTDPYSRCTKMPFVPQYSLWGGEIPCALPESYTYCMRLHGTSQFVYS